MASSTAFLVMALNTTRLTGLSPSTFFLRRTSSTCQLIASPSRSGSVASTSESALFTALAISLKRLRASPCSSQDMAKSLSGSTEPFFSGKSRTWPKLARTVKSEPRYLLMVFALAGDSTITTCITAPQILFRAHHMVEMPLHVKSRIFNVRQIRLILPPGSWVRRPASSNSNSTK